MKNRTTLRSYFLTNSIPTETNFQDFIDSSLNQAEDGIRKADNGPIELEAQGPGGELLHLYGSFQDSAALWKIGHKPAKKGEDGTAGLSVADAQASRLFIRAGDGNVGIGTTTPDARLHVDGPVKINGNHTLEFGAGVAGKEPNAGKIGYGTFDGGASLNLVGAGTGSNRKIQFWNEGGATFNGAVEVRADDKAATITVGTRSNGGGAVYLGNSNHGLRRGFPEANTNNHVGLYTTDGNVYLSGNGASTTQFVLTNAGNVGIGTPEADRPLTVKGGGNEGQWLSLKATDGKTKFHLNNANGGLNIAESGVADYRLMVAPGGNIGIGAHDPAAPLEIRRPNANAYMTFHAPGTHWFSFGQDHAANDDIKISDGNNFKGANYLTIQRGTGNVGIGTTNPGFPLDVQSTFTPNRYAYGYLNPSGTVGNTTNTAAASIRAAGRVLASEFNAISDQRLKIIVGRSDAAADLALLSRLRITDYTMRDRVQFGDQSFKKIIAQELEEIFPQAVHQTPGFLPDIYAPASQVQRQGEALLLGLPTGLPEAATAGQRLKLIGPAGEVLATLVEAADAGSQQLLVAGAGHLADAPREVFVFGLEHSNVRTVDYEAIAMLNVSATQALVRQVETLHQQNAALTEQNRAQSTQLGEVEAALHSLQQQVARLLRESQSVAQPA